MNIVNEIIETNSGLLTSLLIYKEFNFEQASQFLPQAVRAIAAVISDEEVTAVSLAGSHLPVATLLRKVDINRLAVTAAIDVEQASAGVVALLPKLLELLGSNERGFSAVLGERMVLFGAMAGNSGGSFRRH